MYIVELAPVTLDFSTPNSTESAQLALDYIALNGTGHPEKYADYFGYDSNTRVVFHDTLQGNYDQVNLAILIQVDADYDVSNTIDPEVKQRWFPMGLGLEYQPVYDPAHTWICSMGRAKYLTPVYQSL